MASSSSTTINLPLYSAFETDESVIEIVPSFNSTNKVYLLSHASPVGRFQAGIPTRAPLWVALLLHQRSLCTITPPGWLTTENLSEILVYERKQASLWPDSSRLPRHYFELAKRLLSNTSQGTATDKAVLLLIQDLLELRMDKLKQQFQKVLMNEDVNLLVQIDGIGSQELAMLHPFVTQALNDRQFLLQRTETKSFADTSNTGGETTTKTASTADPIRPRVAIRRFRN